MKHSESLFMPIRGVRYHIRCWGDREAPKIFLLHGWMDVSASFQFVVDALAGEWNVLAPDWRGFGDTAWSGTDSYWYPDYLADLDALLDKLEPERPVNLVGHSMGGNIACIYSGSRSKRVSRFVNLEGFGMKDNRPDEAPRRFERWMQDIATEQRFKDYASFEDLADRLMLANSRLSKEKANFLARQWGKLSTNDRVILRSDPAHKRVNPVLYRGAEVAACLGAISAPVLWVQGEDTDMFTRMKVSKEEVDARMSEIGNCRQLTIPSAGHMLHHDNPVAVARAIEQFLA